MLRSMFVHTEVALKGERTGWNGSTKKKKRDLKNRSISERHLPGCTFQILYQPPAPPQAGVQSTPSLLPHSLALEGSEQWRCTDHGRPAGPDRNLTGTPTIEFTGVRTVEFTNALKKKKIWITL